MIKKTLMSIFLCCSGAAWSQNIAVINTGSSTGSSAVLSQEAVKQVPGAELILTKTCKDTQRKISHSKKSLVMVTSHRLALSRISDDPCIPDYQKHQVVWSSETSFYMCRLPTNTKSMTAPGVKIGQVDSHPLYHWTAEFNRLNNGGAVAVPFKGSSDVMKAVFSKDIDWGMLPGLRAKSAESSGAICEYTTDDYLSSSMAKKYQIPFGKFVIQYQLIAIGLSNTEINNIKSLLAQGSFNDFVRSNGYIDLSGPDQHQSFVTWVDALVEMHIKGRK